MKKKFIIPMLAVIVAIVIAFAGTATAKVAPNRGNTPAIRANLDSFDPLCCHYIDPSTGKQCPNLISYWCQDFKECDEHCGK